MAIEDVVRAGVCGRIHFTFRKAVVDLRNAGVVFDPAQVAVTILNGHRRQQGECSSFNRKTAP